MKNIEKLLFVKQMKEYRRRGIREIGASPGGERGMHMGLVDIE